MRIVIWFVLLFVVAVVCATTLGTNDGMVSFFWRVHRVDVSLNFFLLLVLEACFVLVVVMQGIRSLVGLPKRAREWRAVRKDRTAQASLREALALYFGGRYSRSEKLAQRALSVQADVDMLQQDPEFAALAHLLSAANAHRLQDRAGREAQLARVLELSQRSTTNRAVEEGARLLSAEWALDDRDAPRALSLLAELPPGVARRTHALRLKLQATRLGRQPQEALKTARLLIKHQGISAVAAAGLMRSLAFESLDAARDVDQLQRVWLQFDAADRRDPFVAARAATQVAELGAPEHARGWLRPFWDQMGAYTPEERAALSASLVMAIDGIGAEWLPRLEDAARGFGRESPVAHAVGTAMAQLQLWGKAQPLLTQAASDTHADLRTRRQAWLSLAAIAEQDDQMNRAIECYRAAALLGSSRPTSARLDKFEI